MLNQLFYCGKNLEDFGAYVVRHQLDNSPDRVYTDVNIPGRHGKFLRDDKRLSNVTVSYWMLFINHGWDAYCDMKNWLLSEDGYQRIEDTFDPEHYRLGVYRGSTEPVFDRERDLCKCVLKFDCLPQRWIRGGEELRAISSGKLLVNPYLTVAKPLIRVSGIGTLRVSDVVITINSQPTAGFIDIDCDKEDAFSGSTNCNNYISLGTDFPELNPGENAVIFNGLTSVHIAPRWWTV